MKRVTVIDEGRDLWEVRGRLLMFLFVLRGTFFKGAAAIIISSPFRQDARSDGRSLRGRVRSFRPTTPNQNRREGERRRGPRPAELSTRH